MTKFNSLMISHYLSLEPEVVECQISRFLMSKIFSMKFHRYNMFFRYLCVIINFIILNKLKITGSNRKLPVEQNKSKILT
jgi:hypothetical protein